MSVFIIFQVFKVKSFCTAKSLENYLFYVQWLPVMNTLFKIVKRFGPQNIPMRTMYLIMFKTFPPNEIPHLMHMFYVKCPNSSNVYAK
jgi:hypothetical protein